MAGHMGAEQVTTRGLEVLQSDPARGLLLVAGAVPGARNGLLKIRYTQRTLEAARSRKPQTAEREADTSAEDETPVAEEQEAPEAAAEQPAPEAAATEVAEQPEKAAEDEGEAPSDEDKAS
jgi:large subunit ribosomal protein L3